MSGVQLTTPADPASVRFVRLLAAAVADEAGFDFEEVEDLRIAVDELCFAIVGEGGSGASLLVSVDVDGDRDAIVVTGECRGANGMADADDDGRDAQLMARILAAVVDHHDIATNGDARRFTLVKNRRE